MNASICATCLLLSCCASAIARSTSFCSENSFVISAFCAARYGSALLHWLNATKYFFPPACFGPPHPPSKQATAITAIKARILNFFPAFLDRHSKHDDNRLHHHLHVAVYIL